MENIHQDGPQHNVAWTLLPALLVSEHGTTFCTLAPAGSSKMLACVDMWPGGGLDRNMRRGAIKHHDVCQICVHADAPANGTLPLAADFHEPTLLWAIEKASQIAVWSERDTSRRAEVVGWMCDAARDGARFQATICTQPKNAAAWLANVDRWKGDDTKVRLFGPEVLQ